MEAWLQEKKGNRPAAVKYLIQAIENDPDSLNSAYLDGYKIDLGTICQTRYKSANGPAEYSLKLRES